MQARSRSSIRAQLARDLHDSLAQDLVAIGYKLDLLIARLPLRFRADAREVRFLVSESTAQVRRELFSLRRKAENPDSLLTHIETLAKPLNVQVIGKLENLTQNQRRVVEELVRNASAHSKGRQVKVELLDNAIRVSDDGQGLFGIAQLLPKSNLANIKIEINDLGMSVEVPI